MQEDAGVRAARAEAEMRSLQERLREEQTAVDALKKLMGELGRGEGLGLRKVMQATLNAPCVTCVRPCRGIGMATSRHLGDEL